MIRVALVCEFENLNGAERSLLAAVDRLSGVTVQFSVVCPPHGLLTNAFVRRNIPVYPLEWKDSVGKTISMEERRARFADVMTHIQGDPKTAVDLVHANSLSSSRMTGPVCRQAGISSIGHIRDIVRLNRQVIADLNDHAAILCVSEATLQYHREQGLDAKKSYVAYNGIDTRVFYPRWPIPLQGREIIEEETPFLLPNYPSPDPLRIGMAGQISLRKGMDVLLEAMERLAAKRAAGNARATAPLILEIAGSRQSEKAETALLEERIRAKAERINQNQGEHGVLVRFLGQLDSLPDWLRSLDVYVHAARQEPLGRVLLEAAATGTPVVATNVGGTAEIFPSDGSDQNETGFQSRLGAILVPPNDPEKLANALLPLLEGNSASLRRQTLAYQGWRQAVERFTDQQAAQTLFRFYETTR